MLNKPFIEIMGNTAWYCTFFIRYLSSFMFRFLFFFKKTEAKFPIFSQFIPVFNKKISKKLVNLPLEVNKYDLGIEFTSNYRKTKFLYSIYSLEK